VKTGCTLSEAKPAISSVNTFTIESKTGASLKLRGLQIVKIDGRREGGEGGGIFQGATSRRGRILKNVPNFFKVVVACLLSVPFPYLVSVFLLQDHYYTFRLQFKRNFEPQKCDKVPLKFSSFHLVMGYFTKKLFS